MSLRAAAQAMLDALDTMHWTTPEVTAAERVLYDALATPDAAAVGDSEAVAMSSETQTHSADMLVRLDDLADLMERDREFEAALTIRDAIAALSIPSPDIRDAERIRADALREAAAVCDRFAEQQPEFSDERWAARACANAIRSLIPPQEK